VTVCERIDNEHIAVYFYGPVFDSFMSSLFSDVRPPAVQNAVHPLLKQRYTALLQSKEDRVLLRTDLIEIGVSGGEIYGSVRLK